MKSAAVEEDPLERARRIGLDLLSRRPRSRDELSRGLLRRGVAADVIECVCDRFVEVGLLDDASYAETVVRSGHAARGLGRRALSAELARRGVGRDDAAAALATVAPEEHQQAAQDLARRRVRTVAGLPHDVAVRRLAGALARRGHPPGVAYAAARDALADIAPSDTGEPAGDRPERACGTRDGRRTSNP